MQRDSSLEAFRDLNRSGGCTQKQLNVLVFVFKHQDVAKYKGSITRADVETELADDTQSLGPRFAELERMGMLVIHGRKDSCKTGRKIQGWRVPEKFDDDFKTKKKLTTKQALNQLSVEVALVVADLESGKTEKAAPELRQALARAKARQKVGADAT